MPGVPAAYVCLKHTTFRTTTLLTLIVPRFERKINANLNDFD